MVGQKNSKLVTYAVLVSYLSLLNVQPVQAAQSQAASGGQLGAQAGRGLHIDSGQTPSAQPDLGAAATFTAEDRNARESILTGKIQRLEEEMNGYKGMRRNFLNTAVAAFSIGATLTFGVNRVNAAIADISSHNPEENPAPAVEERQDDCQRYECSTSEKDDALKSLAGIKGIGGGIFILGAAALAGYGASTWRIHKQQRAIALLRQESDSLFEARGLTPDYLQRNESVAVALEESEALKKKSGAMHAQEELFLRVAVGSAASGLFLIGLSNVSHTIVGNITISRYAVQLTPTPLFSEARGIRQGSRSPPRSFRREGAGGEWCVTSVTIDDTDLNDVTAKRNALKRTDELQTTGGILLGAGAAAGIISFIFGRFANRREGRIDDLEDSVWRVVEHLEWRPKMNGFTVMYRQTF